MNTLDKFIAEYISVRKRELENRKRILELELLPNIPFYIIERFNELKINTALALDHNIMKLISLTVEYVLMQINIAYEFSNGKGTYVMLQKSHEEGSLARFIEGMQNKKLLDAQSYQFCVQFLSKSKGGMNIRNAEVHNKEAVKVSTIEPKLSNGEELDDFGREFLRGVMTQSPGFIQISSRLMNEPLVIACMEGLRNLCNRYAWLLEKLNGA